jgi:hypothetical protein
MKHLKQTGLAAAMVLVLLACVGATSASATTISPANTAFVLTSTNSSLSVHGSSTINCTNGTVGGTTPSGTATTLTIPVTVAYSGCTAFGVAPASVTVPAACKVGGASAIKLNLMYNSLVDITGAVTIPSGCTITIHVPVLSCTITISGEQTIGASSGMIWQAGSGSVFAVLELLSALLPSISVDAGGGFGCPTAGAHTGTLNGTYRVTTPSTAPGLTVGP